MTDKDFVPPEGFTCLNGEASRSRWAKRRRPHEAKVFDSLPMSVRRDRAVALGWRIRSNGDGAGVFSSHDILPGSREWPVSKGGQVQWADILFISQAGPRTGRIYNATIYTLAVSLAEAICDQAEEAVEAQMSEEDITASQLRMFTRRVPGSLSSEMIFSPHRFLPSLGGVTREAAQAAWVRARWDDLGSLVSKGERARFLPDYAYGTGLDLVTAQANLTVEAIASAIADFRARGEVAYELPMEFASQRATVEAILLGKLWRWDATQARADGKDPPDRPDSKAGALLGYESNAIKL